MVWDKSKGWVGGGGGVCGVGGWGGMWGGWHHFAGGGWVGGGGGGSWVGGWVMPFPEIFPGRYSNSKLPIWPPHVFGTNARVRMHARIREAHC